jgi:hypothetical protein
MTVNGDHATATDMKAPFQMRQPSYGTIAAETLRQDTGTGDTARVTPALPVKSTMLPFPFPANRLFPSSAAMVKDGQRSAPYHYIFFVSPDFLTVIRTRPLLWQGARLANGSVSLESV